MVSSFQELMIMLFIGKKALKGNAIPMKAPACFKYNLKSFLSFHKKIRNAITIVGSSINPDFFTIITIEKDNAI